MRVRRLVLPARGDARLKSFDMALQSARIGGGGRA